MFKSQIQVSSSLQCNCALTSSGSVFKEAKATINSEISLFAKVFIYGGLIIFHKKVGDIVFYKKTRRKIIKRFSDGFTNLYLLNNNILITDDDE